MAIMQGGQQSTLCWECKNTHRDKCSWFNPVDPQPVPGWVAELRPKAMIGESYLVLECPNFKPQRRRENRVAAPPTDGLLHGVYKRKTAGKSPWTARIIKDGKYYHLGSFATMEEANAAQLAAEEAISRGEVPQYKTRPSAAFTGVYPRYRRWEVRITYQGQSIYLGSFADEKEAIAARLAAEEAIKRGEEPCKK